VARKARLLSRPTRAFTGGRFGLAGSARSIKRPRSIQRQRDGFWPISDQTYTLTFAYYLNPDYLSGAFPFAYGGAQHAETLLESCLAIAEKILDDAATVHAAEFEKRLAVSMDLDRRTKPQNLGYNRDQSDQQDRYRHRQDDQHGWSTVQVNGVTY
jgi:hypothetical protein